MSYRLDDLDCLSARAQALETTAIHAVWIYDRPVDMVRLENFHASLERGLLGRVVAPALLGAAGDRWSAKAEFAPIEVEPSCVEYAQLGDWIAQRSRAELHTYGGPAWRLTVTDLDNGGSAVSLLASHTLADAMGLFAAIATAAEGKTLDLQYEADRFGPIRLFLSDVQAITQRLGKVLKAVPGIARSISTNSSEPSAASAVSENCLEPGTFRLPTLIATVPAQQWHAAAKSRGGSANTLTAAVMADLAIGLGRTDAQGRAHLSMPVSTRTDTDMRGNALTGIDFQVDAHNRHAVDLRPLRAEMKEKLKTTASAPHSAAALIPIAVALPRAIFRRLAGKLVASPVKTGFTYIAAPDPILGRIDGADAAATIFGLVEGSDSLPRLQERGGILYAGAFELGESVWLRIMGFHPPNPLDADQFKAAFAKALGGYGLTARFL